MSKIWRKPLDAGKVRPVRGVITIITDRCKGCGFCIELCPRKVLVFSETFNVKGYHPPQVEKSDLCVNCNLCEIVCPEFAIFSVPEEEGGPDAEEGGGAHASGS